MSVSDTAALSGLAGVSLGTEDLARQKIRAQAQVCESRGGIIADHALGLQALATERSACIAIRAVNPFAFPLIRSGRFGTKDMAISGKSSLIPPLCGLIPLDQRYGKTGMAASDAARLTAKNNDAVKQGKATVQPLVLDVSHLRQMDGLVIEGTWPGGGAGAGGLMHGTAGGKDFAFWGEVQTDGVSVAIFGVREEAGGRAKGEPIEVMANRKKLMVTADYDLAFVAPRVEAFGVDQMRPLKIPTLHDVEAVTGVKKDDRVAVGSEDAALFSTEELSASADGKVAMADLHWRRVAQAQGSTEVPYTRQAAIDGKDSPPPMRGLGNISPYIRDMLPRLNSACGTPEGSGLELFHHSDDAGNPFSDEAANYPMTLILPSHASLPDGPRILVIEDRKGLETAIRTLKDSAFMPDTTHAWGKSVASVRSHAFEAARAGLEAFFETRTGQGNVLFSTDSLMGKRI